MRPARNPHVQAFRPLTVALIAAFVMTARGMSQGRVRPPYRATPAPRFDPATIGRITAENLKQYADSLRFATEYGKSDEQRLLIGSYPPGRYGPLATMEPEEGSVALDSAQLDSGRVVARILNHDAIPYVKFGFAPRSITYWWIDRRGTDSTSTGWRSIMISTDSATGRVLSISLHKLVYEPHYSEYPYAQALARYLWSDRDEQLWVTCTSSGCCRAQE